MTPIGYMVSLRAARIHETLFKKDRVSPSCLSHVLLSNMLNVHLLQGNTKEGTELGPDLRGVPEIIGVLDAIWKLLLG